MSGDDLITSLRMDLIIKCEEPRLSEETLFQEESTPAFFFLPFFFFLRMSIAFRGAGQ